MFRSLLVFSCKLLIKLLRLIGKNGSALPGLIIEKVDKNFLKQTLKPVEKNIVLVTGTNGKTTTTKMLVSALRATGKRVVTNTTGSNMTRGLIAALVEDMTLFGQLKPTDWFVFEIDEAYAPILTQHVSPKAVVGLNVLRDQLDRYGEIDKTARYIQDAAMQADAFVYNSLDPLMANVAEKVKQAVGTVVISFGVDKKYADKIANEQTVGSKDKLRVVEQSDVTLRRVDSDAMSQSISLVHEKNEYNFSIPIQGFHNSINATAVAAALIVLVPDKTEASLKSISKMPTPFGRGEQLKLRGKNVTVALVKNPSGFTSNLKTFVVKNKPDAVLFIVNDNIADGRDVSWLWDVDFSKLPKSIKLFTSGIRGYDMALRLQHDDLTSQTTLSVDKAISNIMNGSYKELVVVPTYTALFEAREALGKYGKVEKIW